MENETSHFAPLSELFGVDHNRAKELIEEMLVILHRDAPIMDITIDIIQTFVDLTANEIAYIFFISGLTWGPDFMNECIEYKLPSNS